MARRTRPYDKAKSVKSIARERVGTPPPSRVVEEKAGRDKPKHKKQE
jgi:hypothetical protein